MTTLNEYNDTIRKDIAKDFGLVAGGYAPAPKLIPVRHAMRLLNKYSADHATVIAKRYMALFGGAL